MCFASAATNFLSALAAGVSTGLLSDFGDFVDLEDGIKDFSIDFVVIVVDVERRDAVSDVPMFLVDVEYDIA